MTVEFLLADREPRPARIYRTEPAAQAEEAAFKLREMPRPAQPRFSRFMGLYGNLAGLPANHHEELF